MNRYLFLALSLALAGCAESEEAALVPVEENESFNKIDPIEAAAAPDPNELTLGEWSLGTQEERPVLQFGPAGTQPLFSLRCDDRQGLLLQRHGVVPSGEAEMMTVTLGTSSRRLAVNPVTGTVPMLRAAIPANDQLIAQLGAASAPILIAVSDDPVLNLPPSPAIGDYVESCAMPQETPPAAAETADSTAGSGNSAAEPQQ